MLHVWFQHSQTDTFMFIFRRGTDTGYLLLYVDDIILTASTTAVLHRIIQALSNEFSMTYFGTLSYFLGISVTRNATCMFLSQQKYALDILERAKMLNRSPIKTPVDTDSKLGSSGPSVVDLILYRSIARAL